MIHRICLKRIKDIAIIIWKVTIKTDLKKKKKPFVTHKQIQLLCSRTARSNLQTTKVNTFEMKVWCWSSWTKYYGMMRRMGRVLAVSQVLPYERRTVPSCPQDVSLSPSGRCLLISAPNRPSPLPAQLSQQPSGTPHTKLTWPPTSLEVYREWKVCICHITSS